MRAAAANLRRLLRPRSVAFVGGSVAPFALGECEAFGFDGPIYAVHPKREKIGGRRAYPSVRHLPEAPDAAFVAVNARASVEVVSDLARMGAGGAALYAAGFSEEGTDEGRALEEELRAAAGDVAVLGPNCYGAINFVDGVSLWPVPSPRRRVDRGVAVILQSGNLGINVTMNQRSLPLAFVASVGNQAVLEIADLVEAFLELDEVKGIGIYLEALRDVPRFAAAAGEALERGVPIAAVKAGASRLGERLALTHTGSLAGDDELYDALFARYGIARASSVPDLLESLKALALCGPLGGRRLCAFTCSGAESALVADAASAHGVELPQHRPGTGKELVEALPEFALVSNPLDYNSALWGLEPELHRVFTTALRDPYDAALLVIDYPLPGTPYTTEVDNAVRALARACADAGVPGAVASVLPESLPEHARETMVGSRIVPLQGLEEAISAIAACARYGERLRAGVPPPLQPAGPAPRGTRILDEWASKQLVAEGGIPLPRGRCAEPSAEAAAAASEALAFPVVAKLVSAELPHKEKAGAVRLGLRSPGDVAEAVGSMLAATSVPPTGVLVEEMVGEGRGELLVGVRRDPSFGLVLVAGSGGASVELIGDARPLLLPADADEVLAALRGLRSFPSLGSADLAAACEAALALARLLSSRDDLVELEVNPLLLLDRGVVALDALARIG